MKMKYLKPFMLGIMIAAVFHLFQVMNCDDGNTVSLNGGSNVSGIDMQKIIAGGIAVEKAFASGDSKKVEEILTDEAKVLYKDELPNLESEDMKSFAKDFEKRTLVTAGSFFAEYGFPFQETTYIVRLLRQADGSYKLARF
jgi:hypothetical protein